MGSLPEDSFPRWLGRKRGRRGTTRFPRPLIMIASWNHGDPAGVEKVRIPLFVFFLVPAFAAAVSPAESKWLSITHLYLQNPCLFMIQLSGH
ncbi:hypothetical protein [Halobacillus sp. A5]|uniref:hypothetical protein n=1 Tax=Halobacillus sp. A5 TaxID=2880263 RepID=UPI0020A6D1EF|nr:hypothetical protein [Halobacillus sp. A5]MCP3029440.1 hypothetical protein [Halobacillus sp. A5]